MKSLLVIAALLLAGDPVWELELTTGEVLQGVLVEQTDGAVVFDHPVLGRLTIPADSIVELREMPAPGAPPTAPPPAVAEKAEPQVLDDAIVVQPAEKVKGEWKSTFSLGLNASSGKTDETSFRLGLDSVYSDPTQRYTFDSFYVYKQTDSVTTENKFTAGARGDWPFTGSRWGYFGQGRYDFDEFQSWRHRVTAGGGFTYLLVNVDSIDPDEDTPHMDDLTLTASGGVGLIKEFGSTETSLQGEGILGLDFRWNISRRQALNVDLTYFPGITRSDYRIVSRGGWSLRLDNLDGISLSAGYYYEYQSNPDPGIDPNDLQLFVALGIDF